MNGREPALDRLRRYHSGRISEMAAAAALVCKGYRILARRWRSPYGEIDLIAVRGRRLAFVEVKRRASREEALAALAPRQVDRMRRAAAFFVAERPSHSKRDIGLDVIIVLPRRWPMHLPDALQASGNIDVYR